MKYLQLVKAIDAASKQLLGRAAAAVNQALVLRNWLIGAYIVEFEQNGEDRAKYGARLLVSLRADLIARGLGGLSISTLERMRRLYQCYPQLAAQIPSTLLTESGTRLDFKVLSIPSTVLTESPPASRQPAIRGTLPPESITPLSPQLVLRFSWSQLQEFIRLDEPLQRAFYENECLKGNWSVRQLQRQIGSLLFERTGLSKNKAAVVARARRQESQQDIENLIRDPYVLEFTGLGERPEYTESDLETALLNHLQKFLLELGAGFLFEARQRRITTGNEHDYIDLVFYHRHLRCHVLLDLKVRAFKHGDAGQMNFYLNWWRKNITGPGEQPPVGIILCSDKDHTKVQFATAGMDNKLFVSRYRTALPTAEQLQRFVEADRERVEAVMNQGDRARPRKPKRKKKGKVQKRRATGNFP